MALIAVVVALLYASGVRSLARRDHAWPVQRSVAAGGAVVAMSGASVVPGGSLTGHMIEHILLGMVAPLLLALAAPVTLALQTTPPWLRPTIRSWVHSRPAVWLSHPGVGLVAFAGSLVALYLTPLLGFSARHVVVHVLVHLMLVVAGSLLVWPIVGIDPIPRRVGVGIRLLAVVAAVPFHAFLGVVIMSTDTLLAPRSYRSLSDQHRAGGLLWMSGELMSFTLATIVLRQWFAADRRAAARERLHDARVAVRQAE